MGTRSRIGIVQKTIEGSFGTESEVIKSIYCHYDGYIGHTGEVLFNHYKSRELVESLISKGDMSFLYPNPSEISHYREREPGHHNDALTAKGRSELLSQADSSWGEYVYLMDEIGEWYVCHRASGSDKFHLLKAVLSVPKFLEINMY